MRRRTELPAGIPCDRDLLRSIYTRQFRESSQLRRHVLSLLPLNTVKSIFEPGCGPGFLGHEIMALSDGVYTGMDIDSGILPDSGNFKIGNAEDNPPEADLYVSSFFFSSLRDPAGWLKRVPTGMFAVLAEYDYQTIEEEPCMGIAEKLRKGLEFHGISPVHGGALDGSFAKAGFEKVYGGEAWSRFQRPHREFLALHVNDLPDLLPLMRWRVVWGIWRRRK